MGFFGPKHDPGTEGPSLSNPRSITGHPMREPEVPGGQPRRSRLFSEAIHFGVGRASRQAQLESIMSREASLVKWVSLRAALTHLSFALENRERTFSDLQALAGEPEPQGFKELLDAYPTIATLSLDQVNGDPRLVRTPEWHFAAISWGATVFANATDFALLNPGAQALETPGWYADPAFAKAERFWDGGDWTPRCRVFDGRRYMAGSNAL